MRTRIIVVIVLLALAGGGALYWQRNGGAAAPGGFELYGNVDIRQVSLAFRETERILSVEVEEGDPVAKGQVVARLDTSLLAPQVAGAEAATEAQRAVVRRLEAGNRPQEIAKARAEAAAAKAELTDAELVLARRSELLGSGSTTRQEVDSAQAARDVAAAHLRLARQNLDLLREGSRVEDLDEARARLASLEADLAYLRQRLEQTELAAPADGVVRNRLLEPGDMAGAQRPVLTLALTEPKWVRAYVNETDLGRVRPGMPMGVTVDAFPGKVFPGWVGFISPMAEFTPRSVETPELRTYLVYEVRVQVRDPEGLLRLGMPATVAPSGGAPAPAGGAQ